TTPIMVNDKEVGDISVIYSEERPPAIHGPFLEEEKRLLETIANRLSYFIMYQKLKMVFSKWESAKEDITSKKQGEWQIVLELLQRTDPDLYIRISRKMLNHLIWTGVDEAERLLQAFSPVPQYQYSDVSGETNTPLTKQIFENSTKISKEVFLMAERHLSNTEILSNIQKWMQQDKTAFLVRATSNNDSSLNDIVEALYKYYQIAPDGLQLMPSTRTGVRASLIRRFFSDQLEFINIAKNYVRVNDFYDLVRRVIFPTGSHGKLGGKSAGLFLARRILRRNLKDTPLEAMIKTPRTWHLSSDTLIHFMHFNNLEEILEQKYKSIEEIRQEYPHVVQLFKSSHFPPDIVNGLSVALDDFGERPLIVRSSSLLEDRLGSAFSGKYKSLFLTNQGSKQKRLEALMDAIAEVYASTIGPDPIEYRAERGLLDFHEEMGIMIQEVVGTRVGKYFLPSYAGVAFSNNEFRWSPRIRREDGLIRLVVGLGTRAVDRLADDYPILVAPGQPGLRTNVSITEIVRYSPQKADVLNLENGCFESVELRDLFREAGNDIPGIEQMVSIFEHNNIRKPMGINVDYTREDLVATFDGLISDSPVIKGLGTILRELQKALATPVDIEFASNGKELYLLQCRPQSYSKYDAPSPIPDNLDPKHILFSANRYISNGLVPEITHVVYVNPDKYNEISDLNRLKRVGKAVGKLNKVLPKRKFILMGPGRWGSRGDIKLGVSVTYSDINNTAVLIEIARKKGNYMPDLSFGTHFFQDLVEASIRYLPLYPDNEQVVFKEDFFANSPNSLSKYLTDYADLEDVLRVIEIDKVYKGQVLKILMNADQEKAVAVVAPPKAANMEMLDANPLFNTDGSAHSVWRQQMAEQIASRLNPTRFGVKGIYLAGSSAEKTAQPGSDIDLFIRFKGTEEQRRELESWLEGWSLCLDEINFRRTGFKSGRLLDIHFLKGEEDTSKMKKLLFAVQ
ncbi:MAG TPA: pyruvate, phosphate dikinase, partial [Caldithrix abyssi]|nr:pyruvate, phosphate dikinase [Caldithrix abyssi]